MLCPCGSTLTLTDCCLPIIEHKKIAISPEQLMRSRYTAYALSKATYIYDTYASETRQQQSVADIKDWAAQTIWLSLTIVERSDYPQLPGSTALNEAEPYPKDDNQADQKQFSKKQSPQCSTSSPTVTFSALYIYDKKLFTMTEKSRFIVEDEEWRYLNGEFESDDGQPLPNRNAPCPCGSRKKFKRCCGKTL